MLLVRVMHLDLGLKKIYLVLSNTLAFQKHLTNTDAETDANNIALTTVRLVELTWTALYDLKQLTLVLYTCYAWSSR